MDYPGVGFDGLTGNSLLAIYGYVAADIRLLAGKLGILALRTTSDNMANHTENSGD